MVDLFERLADFVVEVNNYPFHRKQIIDEVKGITRIYGRDGDREKINRVIYSKPYYTRKYIEESILKEYDNCPLCNIGVPIVSIVKTKKRISVKQPIALYFLLGAVSLPIILYTLKKKLTISES